jgi:hypothetical protein
VLATQNNNPGSWGAVVAGVLTHSGLVVRRVGRRFGGVRRAFRA